MVRVLLPEHSGLAQLVSAPDFGSGYSGSNPLSCTMESIQLGDKVFQWKVTDDGYGMSFTTVFYYGVHKFSRRKWLLWGPVIEIERPSYAFEVLMDITSTNYTKDTVKHIVMDAYRKWEGLSVRKEQIARREYI